MSSAENSHHVETDLDDGEYVVEMIREAERDLAGVGLGASDEEMLAFFLERAKGNSKVPWPEQIIVY
jgi:hypothetical protein